MKRMIAALGLALAAASAFAAEETIRDFSWVELQKEGKPVVGEISPAGGAESFETIKVSNAESAPRGFALLSIDSPGVTSARYVLRGQVKCEEVAGQGYLEMWNYFPDGGAYFSRTLAATGPMGALSGTQSWRPFELPFTNKEGAPGPVKLVFGVVLPGKGAVWLSGVRLAQYPAGSVAQGGAAQGPVVRHDLGRINLLTWGALALAFAIAGAMWVKRGSPGALGALAWAFVAVVALYAVGLGMEIARRLAGGAPARAGAWWSDEAAGLVGGSAGGVLGLCGAMIGVFTSCGVGRRIVLGILYGMLGVGVFCLIGGALALAKSQPYAVFYPLLLIGVLETAMPIYFIPLTKRRFQEMELRRMSAMDAGV